MKLPSRRPCHNKVPPFLFCWTADSSPQQLGWLADRQGFPPGFLKKNEWPTGIPSLELALRLLLKAGTGRHEEGDQN